MSDTYLPRSNTWRWYVCAILFLATTINYIDRQTLAQTAKRIQAECSLNDEQYGNLELGFGLAFASGGFFFGILADKFGVYWIYPAVLLLWSTMGVITGKVRDYDELLYCRILLGFFESGHWPCALRTTQRILAPKDRGMGNSLLQGGTSIGAIIVPLLMNWLLTNEPGSWRWPFMAIGFSGMFWIFLWFPAVRRKDLLAPPPTDDAKSQNVDPGGDQSYWQIVFSRRYLVLILMVIAINVPWHLFRVWLPKYLQHDSGGQLTEPAANWFTSIFYLATEVGVLTAGAVLLRLPRMGMSVYGSRALVFSVFGILTLATTATALLPAGNWFLFSILVVGFGNLGLFPCYYSFTQELSHKHQGKVSGLLTTFAWTVPALVHKYFGKYIDRTGSYDLGFGLVGWLPLIALLALVLLWNTGPFAKKQTT